MQKLKPIILYAETILKGLSQIFLQENRFSGAIILLGLIIGGWEMALAATLAALAGNIFALLLGFKREEVRAGLYGFSPALCGAVLLFLFKGTWIIWLLVIVAGILSALLQHIFIQSKIKAFTFPFILVSWILIFLLNKYTEPQPLSQNSEEDILAGSIVGSAFRGFGQVVFQGGLLAGILFLLAVFIGNPSSAIYGLSAALATTVIANLLEVPTSQINQGLFGYNAVLTAIVFSGNRKADALWAAVGICITIGIHFLLMKTNILANVGGVLTFPFVAGVWTTMGLQRLLKRREHISIE